MYMVKSGKFKEFKALPFTNWFAKEENIQRLKSALPEGVRYIDAYAVIWNSAEHDYEIWFELDNWAALDTWRVHDKWWDFYEQKIEEIGVYDKTKPVNKFLRGMTDVKISDPQSSKD
ncbi:MAG: hypothetical protein ACXAAM_01935 [Candidatus Heimdallarchaeaceae archaeon]